MPHNPSSRRSKASRSLSAAAREERESHVQLAVSELATGQHKSIAAAARTHELPESTVQHCLHGCIPKKEAQNNMQALLPASESVLVEHIQHCACSGFPLTPSDIHKFAHSLMHSSFAQGQPVKLGHCWLQSFLLHHPSITSSWSCCLDNAQPGN